MKNGTLSHKSEQEILNILENLQQKRDESSILLGEVQEQHQTANDLSSQIQQKRDEANNLLSEVQQHHQTANNLSSEIQQKQDDANNLFSEVQQRHQTANNLSSEIQQKRDEANNLLGEVQQHRQTANDVSTEIQQKRDKANNLLDGVRQHHQTANDVSTEIQQKQDEANNLFSEVQQRHQTANELSTEIQQKRDQASNMLEELRSQHETVINLYKEYKNLVDIIENLLPGATTASLASEYELAHNEIQTRRYWLGFVFSLTILLVGYVYFLLIPYSSDKPFEWTKIAVSTTAGLPLLWIAWYCQRSISQINRIREEYNHKLRIMKLYDGFSKQILQLEDNPQTKSQLVSAILEAVRKNPAETLGPPSTFADILKPSDKN